MSTIKNNPPSKGTSIVCSIIGNILLVIGLVLAVVPIAAAIVGYTKDGFIQNEFLLTAICLEFVGIFLMFIGAAVTAFGKFGLLDFSVPKGNEIVNYPTSESKLTKEQLLQEAASEKDIPASIQAIKVQGDRIDFIAKWDGLRPSQSETFKKMIFVQDDFTYRELDYEYGEMIGPGDAGPNPSGTTIGKVQKRKIIYRKSQDGSITREVIDTTNITNDIHKWLADRGYSKVG